MELFPPSDEAQWQYIKRVIDQCDYYILILAFRYGSIDEDTGLSYTEKEYMYAESLGKPIIAFLRRSAEGLDHTFVEKDVRSQKKLDKFRSHVMKKLIKTYSDTLELYGCAMHGIQHLKNTRPEGGWVPARLLPPKPIQEELDALRTENEALKIRLDKAQKGKNCIHAIDVPKNFLEARSSILDYLSESLRTSDYITIRVMAVSLHYSWDFLEEYIPILLANAPPHKRINVELQMVEPKHLGAYLLEDWQKKGLIIEGRIAEFVRRACEDGGLIKEGRLELSLYHYRNIPHWHGMLINGNYLFLGRTRWTVQSDKQILRLSVGEQPYRIFAGNDSFGGSDRIAMFTCWFDYYKFSGQLIVKHVVSQG